MKIKPLKLIKVVGKYRSTKLAEYLCFCGNKFITHMPFVKSGHTKSCGCYNKWLQKNRCITHGESGSKLYVCWSEMKRRCCNIKDKAYKNYGGRGIKVCSKWNNSFEEFRNWATSHGYKKSLELDRIKVNGNYTPSNCRFTTTKINAVNRRPVKNTTGYQGVSCIYYKGKIQCYRSRICINSNLVDLGRFNTPEEAHIAYKKAAKKRLRKYHQEIKNGKTS